jgi:hypothetical protein
MQNKSLERKLPNEECGRYSKMLLFLAEAPSCGSGRIKTFFFVVCTCLLFRNNSTPGDVGSFVVVLAVPCQLDVKS